MQWLLAANSVKAAAALQKGLSYTSALRLPLSDASSLIHLPLQRSLNIPSAWIQTAVGRQQLLTRYSAIRPNPSGPATLDWLVGRHACKCKIQLDTVHSSLLPLLFMVKRVGAKVARSFKECFSFYTSEPTGNILLKLS